MTAPVSYQTKDPHTVQAMQYNAWDGTGNDVKSWIVGLLETAFSPETITINDDGYGPFEVYVGPDFLVRVDSGEYVYLDEDGFHSASKGAFEMIYRKVPPA